MFDALIDQISKGRCLEMEVVDEWWLGRMLAQSKEYVGESSCQRQAGNFLSATLRSAQMELPRLTSEQTLSSIKITLVGGGGE